MKTAKELFERLRTDEAFATEFTEALQSKRKAGAKNYYETMIPAANMIQIHIVRAIHQRTLLRTMLRHTLTGMQTQRA